MNEPENKWTDFESHSSYTRCGTDELVMLDKEQYNYAKVRIDACDVLQQELDAVRMEIDRLLGALTDIRDSNGWIGTDHKYMKLLASEALAAQQENG